MVHWSSPNFFEEFTRIRADLSRQMDVEQMYSMEATAKTTPRLMCGVRVKNPGGDPQNR